MRRSRGRKRAIPKNRGDGQWFGFGRQVEDAISGWNFPKVFMVKQCGGLVSRFLKDGSLDLEDGRLDRGCGGGRSMPPVLSIVATTDTCIEGESTGLFTVSRTGDTSQALVVPLVISGTAVNGTDYTLISSTVTIPAGSSSVTITVTPTDDDSTEGDETVTIQIDPPVDHSDYYIEIGSDNATVTISDPEAAPEASFLLVYRFEDSPGLLVNEGTLGTSFNLLEDGDCEA